MRLCKNNFKTRDMRSTRLLSLVLLTLGSYSGLHAQGDSGLSGKNNLVLKVDLTRLSYPVEKLFFTFYNTTSKFRYTDSALVDAGKIVVFRTAIDEPILAQLRVVPVPGAGSSEGQGRRPSSARDNFSLYIEPGKLEAVAVDSLRNTTVTGSSSEKDYLVFKEKEAPYVKVLEGIYNSYTQARKDHDSIALAAMYQQLDSVEAVLKEKVYKEFVLEKGKTSPVAIYALSLYTGFSIDPKVAQPLYDELGESIKGLPAGIAFAHRIEVARQLQVGQSAIEFTLQDTLGQPVSLSSFRGKYVLIDFWASWCGPCRAENPTVVKAYNKYKDKGFTILGISLDRPGQKDKWLKAIHDDGLTWTHVSDLKFWDNEVAKLYDIKAIPTNFLVDKSGKIVARDIQGEALDSTLGGLIK
jgi:peroxiredoxin